jgi:hypothetical protein
MALPARSRSPDRQIEAGSRLSRRLDPCCSLTVHKFDRAAAEDQTLYLAALSRILSSIALDQAIP